MSNKLALRDHRLHIMEGVLAWEGEIGNARVRKLFGLQLVQASRLLAEFRALMSDRLVEDGRAKVLKPASPEAIQTDISLDEYFRQTQAAGAEDESSCVIDARVDLTEVRPAVFATLRKAAITRTAVTIAYASMTNPTLEERKIFPHSIIQVGRRWHTRAWCARRQAFRDFTLGRVAWATPINEQATQSKEHDEGWHRIVLLELKAHRHLSEEQQQVVQNEFFQGIQEKRLPVRACLAQYVIQDIRATTLPERDLPPEFQIEITNTEALSSVLF